MKRRPELNLSEISPGVAAVLAGAVLACAISVMAWNYAVRVKSDHWEFFMGPAPAQAANRPPESAKLPEK